MWLEGDLLVPGEAVAASVLVWDRAWPEGLPDSDDPSGRVLVVPKVRGNGPTEGHAASSRRYAALITGVLEPPWPGEPPFGPVVRLDPDLFRSGERVRVEGVSGRVEIQGVEDVPVVTAFLEAPDGRVLLLRRSQRVGTFQGRWAGVSGYIESETAETQVYREVREEVGLPPKSLHLERSGRTIYVREGLRVFSVHPFRFRVFGLDFRLDWEHTEAEWVDPSEIGRRETVPKLDRAWDAVRSEGNR